MSWKSSLLRLRMECGALLQSPADSPRRCSRCAEAASVVLHLSLSLCRGGHVFSKKFWIAGFTRCGCSIW